jgi:hypothetical protein
MKKIKMSFYDYLVTNMLLYFDKFEDELQNRSYQTLLPQNMKKKKKTLGDDLETRTFG